MDFSQKKDAATVALLESGGIASSADHLKLKLKEADELAPAPADDVDTTRLRLSRALRVGGGSMMIVSAFMMSLMDMGAWPWGEPWWRLDVAAGAVAVAYASFAGLVWLGSRTPLDGTGPWKKLAAKLVATVIGGAIVWCTGSIAPCNLLIFIIYF